VSRPRLSTGRLRAVALALWLAVGLSALLASACRDAGAGGYGATQGGTGRAPGAALLSTPTPLRPTPTPPR
jgi:hypothetical protein